MLIIEMGSWEKLVGYSECVLCTVLDHTGKCQEAVLWEGLTGQLCSRYVDRQANVGALMRLF